MFPQKKDSVIVTVELEQVLEYIPKSGGLHYICEVTWEKTLKICSIFSVIVGERVEILWEIYRAAANYVYRVTSSKNLLQPLQASPRLMEVLLHTFRLHFIFVLQLCKHDGILDLI